MHWFKMKKISKKKRKRGGQPGNLNALKHGFYSRLFREPEIADLDTLAMLESVGVDDLRGEVVMMRPIWPGLWM